MFGAGAVQVPGWARLRSRQMEAVAARLTESEGPPRLDDPETSGD
jgi:hypothetical protein